MFPEYQAQIDTLRAQDRRFSYLCTKHSALDQQIRAMQGQKSSALQLSIEQLKREKLAIKQTVYAMLQQAQTARAA